MHKALTPRARRAERRFMRRASTSTPTDVTLLAASPAASALPPSSTEPQGKLGLLVQTLRRPGGVTLEELGAIAGWQPHSVRGALSGALKRHGFIVHAEKSPDASPRRYYLVEQQTATRE
jgi:hypothetical protein